MSKDCAGKKKDADKRYDDMNTIDISEEPYTPTEDNNSEIDERDQIRELMVPHAAALPSLGGENTIYMRSIDVNNIRNAVNTYIGKRNAMKMTTLI